MIDDQTYKKLKKCTCLNLGDFIRFCDFFPEVCISGCYINTFNMPTMLFPSLLIRTFVFVKSQIQIKVQTLKKVAEQC